MKSPHKSSNFFLDSKKNLSSTEMSLEMPSFAKLPKCGSSADTLFSLPSQEMNYSEEHFQSRQNKGLSLSYSLFTPQGVSPRKAKLGMEVLSSIRV
jgi:hypothetical protein